jgi:hypothetical protein
MILRDKFVVKPSLKIGCCLPIFDDRRLGALQEPRNRLWA